MFIDCEVYAMCEDIVAYYKAYKYSKLVGMWDKQRKYYRLYMEAIIDLYDYCGEMIEYQDAINILEEYDNLW